jgi:hypothetical protein
MVPSTDIIIEFDWTPFTVYLLPKIWQIVSRWLFAFELSGLIL